MRAALLLALTLISWSAGCSSALAPSDTDLNGGTGLTGLVVRGPLQPVCQVLVPCEGPFSAAFTVMQGRRVVATFHSDTQGHFAVPLSPGTYLIVPGQNAPIMSPGGQVKQVEVGPDGPTDVRLEFDTGIR